MNLLQSHDSEKKAGKICEAKIYFIFEKLGVHEKLEVPQCELV